MGWRKFIAVSTFTVVLVGLVACQAPTGDNVSPSGDTSSPTPRVNDLMRGASPVTSCLTLAFYDGSQGYTQNLCDSSAALVALNDLGAVAATPAPDWSVSDVTMPIYGITMGTNWGEQTYAAWSNGYWITEQGDAYNFDFDFAQMASTGAWISRTDIDSITGFPCARWLVQDQTGWHADLMSQAAPLEPPTGISMTLDSWVANSIAVTFHNQSASDWTYGAAFSLEVQLSGTWYGVPPVPGPVSWAAIQYGVAAGDQASQNYDLTMYGQLPAGTYRLVVEGVTLINDWAG